MSYRLQVLIPPGLDAQLRKAAQRSRLSKGAWVRRALEESLQGSTPGHSRRDAVARMAALNAPTCDIGQMLSEIEAGRQ